jgi:hypothetical protein
VCNSCLRAHDFGWHYHGVSSIAAAVAWDAQRKGVPYVVGRARYRDNARGGVIGDDAGFLKLIYRAGDMQLIGAHMLGEQAIELIDIGLLTMQTNATFQTFIDACFNFPSLAELDKYATYDAMKRKQQGRVQGSAVQIEPAPIAHENRFGARVVPAAKRELV